MQILISRLLRGCLGLVCVWAFMTPAALMAEADKPTLIQIPEKPVATIGLDEVRIGMRGYGMTVFQGTEPEPMTFEVLSIAHVSPGRQVVWVQCPEERMQHSGPVQGMSGSPMYIWDEGEEQIPGKGGRLLGAFAFGFSYSKGCLVGIQPIGYMREAGRRAAAQREKPGGPQDEAAAAPASAAGGEAAETLGRVLAMAAENPRGQQPTYMTELLQRALQPREAAGAHGLASRWAPPAPVPRIQSRGGADADALALRQAMRSAKPLSIPMNVGSTEIALAAAPLFEPLGITPVAAAQGAGFGAPPYGTDVNTPIRPGSVLSVPLAFGDMTMAAAGTVTDVLPDGTILGFGHPMFGEGPLSVPLATGYVDFIVPSIAISFKHAGTLQIVGTLVQDEGVAVAGVNQKQFATVPVKVGTTFEGLDAANYQYEVAQHQRLTPLLAATLVAQSMNAVQKAPPLSTIRWQADMRFTGGRELFMTSAMAGANPRALLAQLATPLIAATQNPYTPLELEDMKVTLSIEKGLKSAQLLEAVLDRRNVYPGDTVGITVTLKPHGQPKVKRRLTLVVPEDAPPGEYPLMISGASAYAMQTLGQKQHLMMPSSVDELLDLVRRINAIDNEKLYAALPLPQMEVAVGSEELPGLPTSRRSLFEAPAGTAITQYTEPVTAETEAGYLMDGELMLQLVIQSPQGDDF